MSENFFAIVSRMRYIERWALMRNARPENLSEHSLDVAMIAHALCTIGNVRYGKTLNADKAAVVALFHDASEIITGDMPTPVKYGSDDLRDAYKKVEAQAEDRLLAQLPEDLQPVYREIFRPARQSLAESRQDMQEKDSPSALTDNRKPSCDAADKRNPSCDAANKDSKQETLAEEKESSSEMYMRRLVKAADKLSALIKCMEEESAGNQEFRTAKITTEEAVQKMAAEMPEVDTFVKEFLPPYGHTLDQLLKE